MRWFDIGIAAAKSLPVTKEVADIWAGWGIAGQSIFTRTDRPKTIEPMQRALEFYEQTSNAAGGFRVGSSVQELHREEYGATELVRRAMALQPEGSPESVRLRSRYNRVLGVSQVDAAATAIDELRIVLKDAQSLGDRSICSIHSARRIRRP